MVLQQQQVTFNLKISDLLVCIGTAAVAVAAAAEHAEVNAAVLPAVE